MPSTIISTSFLGCYSLSKIYIGKDVGIKKIDLSTTNINHLTTPDKYNPLTENNVIAIESKELVKFPKKEEGEKDQIKELNNSIATLDQNIQNLKQELTKEKLDKQELQKKTDELQELVNFWKGQANLINKQTQELKNKVKFQTNIANNHLKNLQLAQAKISNLETDNTKLKKQINGKDKELTQKNNQINSLESQVSDLRVQIIDLQDSQIYG